MSGPVREILASFDALPDADKHEAVEEILRRSPILERDLPESTLHDLADELFAKLDSEEATRADR